MMRLIANVVLALLGNALGLIVADWLLDGVSLDAGGFVLALAIFTVAVVLFQPLVIKMSLKYSRALAGGSALIATLAALIVTVIVSDGLKIDGIGNWIATTVIVWVVSLLGALLLPMVLFKKALGRETGAAPGPQTYRP
jgi:putative membrane protein